PRTQLQQLRERNTTATLLMTRGPEAVAVLTPEGEWLEVLPYPLPPLDRMGAGEVFKAGIIHGILDGMELLDTVRFASAAAALWVALPSALKQPPQLAEILALQEERGARPVLQSWPRAQETVCPICRRVVATALFEKHWEMDRRVIRTLRDKHPAWRRADGACPSCVHETVPQAGLTRATADIPRELADHPIYGQGEPHALPSGIRLRANPHYHGRGVKMAFLDSGFYPHPDLTQPENRILDFVDATMEEVMVGADFSVPRLTSWHGMMTSVVAAGNGYLSDGYYAGLANEAKLLLVKVSDPQMCINEVDILRGLRWLVDHWREYGIQVVNLSVGGDEGLRPDCELNELVNHLVDDGVVVVAAAGNLGRDDLCPPASATNAITVGGLDDRNSLDPATDRMWHSNWGRIGQQVLKPELIAPSIWLAAPVLPGTPTAEQNLILDRLYRMKDKELPEHLASRLHDLNLDPDILDEPVEAMRMAVLQKLIANKFVSPFYQHVDGTSFAAPIVSSVVAQMLEANPKLTARRVKELLIATAQRLPSVPEYQQGYGVVVPGKAVAAALHELYGHYEGGHLSPQVSDGTVRFIFHEPRATQVSVIGEWNEWNPLAQPMSQRESGVWVTEMRSPPTGRYHYKFLIDEAQWLDDPENLKKAVDGYGGFNAILAIS
ncbi:MAG: S8 family serine peptidase, partial [Ardenticatenales bacterium]|nr:S8 family serine peptidase [Ardenticatenales bacterium]